MAAAEGVPVAAKPAVSGRRAVVAIVCWLLSSIGVLMSLTVFTATALAALVTEPIAQVLRDPASYLGFAVAYAWASFAVMTIAWVHDRHVAWHWPVFGVLVGTASAIVLSPFFLFFLPGAALAVYLTVFHLSKR